MTRATLLTASLAALLVAAALPLAGADPHPTDKVGPGTQLSISWSGADRGGHTVNTVGRGTDRFCTANWVWKDQAGKMYLGTAGHCLVPLGKTTAPGPDFVDTSNVRVFACRSACVLGGFAGYYQSNAAIAGPASDWVELGPVAYATFSASSVADDFGILEIPASLYADVSPDLKGWGGPVGSAPVAGNDVLVLHGAGSLVAETLATKSRAGVFDPPSGTAVWVGAVASYGGDSGGPVGKLVVSGPDAGKVQAVGYLTRASGCSDACPKAQGPTVLSAVNVAHQASLCLELVLAGHDLATEPPAAAC
ncbi:MAG: hypothetical protein QOI63_1377 [Thermoplasmata archaeon]|jgi:hypothetical protein|nr:hypothetical protein [Thermoplasmata archaeon]